MIQVYADGVLAYDSRLEDYDLHALKISTGLNKGGTAEIVMPPQHPAYSLFIGYKTVVEIYRDNVLKFRGRALYPVDDYYNRRTVVCEGELCFFQDAISRPYLYQADPAEIFALVLQSYNDQVEPFKQFKLGSIDVTDPNNYVRLESEEAEPVLSTLNKLVERCGGYIVFNTEPDGSRAVSWLEAVGHRSNQVIEVGENLFDVSRSGSNTNLATALIPYGAKIAGKRLTIESVNGGLDYITDPEAVELRGTITTTATWDDVTDPENLLRKALQYLDECKLAVSSLTLTALDLSYIDKSIDSYEVGDIIRVQSREHRIDEDFQLVTHTEDMLNPASSTITLGKEIRSLTGMDVAGDSKSLSALQKAVTAVKADYKANDELVVTETETKFTALIEQKATNILLEVSKTYAKSTEITSAINLLAGNIGLEVTGALGSQASIKLNVNGTQTEQKLNLSDVRAAFAKDTSSAEINAGTITFNSGTLVINSTNLKVSKDGTITATNAVLSGTATTENELHKSELSAGRLRFFYDGTEYGGIASGYIGGDNNVRGVAVRLESEAKYIGFSKLDAEGDGYDMAYCINYGAHPGGRTERHIFIGSAYFGNGLRIDGETYMTNRLTVKGNIDIEGAYSLRFKTTAGTTINAFGKYADDDSLFVGHDDHKIYVYGTEVVLGSASGGKVYIRGESAHVNSPFTFNHFAYFTSNAHFLANTIVSNNTGMKGNNAAGTDTIWMAAVNNLNEVILGDADYTTYIQGSSILIGTGSSTVTVRTNLDVSGAVQFNNGFGVQVKNTAGADCYILSLNNSNQVSVGHLDCPMYLRGTSVTVNTGNLTVYQGSVMMSNGYGIQGRDTAGSYYYILSVNSSNQVSVGTSSLQLYLRGSGVYLSSSGAAVTSDRRRKNSIEELPAAYEAMLDKLTPVRYKYNDGASGRYHAGFIAQDVKAALEAAGLTTKDFGGFVDINGDGEELGLIYSEFIALLLNKIKRQEQRIAALEAAR